MPAVGRDAALGGLGLYLVAQMSGAHGWTVDDRGPQGRLGAHRRGTGRRATSRRGRRRPCSGVRRPGPAGADRGRPCRRRRGPRRRAPRRFSVVVTAVVLVLTLGLAWLASVVNARNSERLLHQQVVQVSTLLPPSWRAARSRCPTPGRWRSRPTASPARSRGSPTRRCPASGVSLSLWRVSGEPGPAAGAARSRAAAARRRPGVVLPDPEADRRAHHRRHPPGAGAPAGLRADAAGRHRPGGLRRDPAEPPRLRRDRRRVRRPGPGGLPGRTQDADQLIQTTAPLPIRGNTVTVQVPFANTSFTLVAASRTGGLTGPLSAALPWIVLGVGGVLALAVGAARWRRCPGGGRSRRGWPPRTSGSTRSSASIAGTLQHALLPEVPRAGRGGGRRPLRRRRRRARGRRRLVRRHHARRRACCVFVVGDVSGQGLPAATTMAALRFAVRAYLAQDDDIATVLTKLRGLLDIDRRPPVRHRAARRARPGDRRASGSSRPGTSPRCCSAAAARSCSSARSRPRSGWRPGPRRRVAELRVSGPATLLAFTDGAVERRGEVIDTGLERLRSTAAAAGGAAAARRPRPPDGRPRRAGRPRRHRDPRPALEGLTDYARPRRQPTRPASAAAAPAASAPWCREAHSCGSRETSVVEDRRACRSRGRPARRRASHRLAGASGSCGWSVCWRVEAGAAEVAVEQARRDGVGRQRHGGARARPSTRGAAGGRRRSTTARAATSGW